MLRIFFGLELPEAQRAALALRQAMLPLPRRVDPADFHLTLAFLGERRDDEIEAAHEAALRVRAAPFELTVADLGLFGGEKPRVAWAGVLPCPPLDDLAARLVAALRQAGLDPEARRFTPHITLARFSRLPLPEALRLERAVAETSFRLDPFMVESFAMFRAHTGVKVGKYQALMRYPLEG